MKSARCLTWVAVAACCGGLVACGTAEDTRPSDAPATVLPAATPHGGPVGIEAWGRSAAEIVARLEGATLHRTSNALAVALEHRRFVPVVLDRRGTHRLTGQSALHETGIRVVIGSGFVSEFQSLEPLGLLQIDGTIVSPVSRHGYTRIVGVHNGRLGVIGRGDYHRGLLESALQVGPGIIEAGALDISPRERDLPAYFRAFIATCVDHDLAGITTSPMHLYDLGNELLALFAEANLQCSEVANLSGDREALLGLRAAERVFLIGHATAAKAALIGFREVDAQH